MRLAYTAGCDVEAIVTGEVDIRRVEHGLLSERAFEHCGLEIVDHMFPIPLCGDGQLTC